jgi:4-amino-4-deoxy-L-arabinose transferase-like glycosyltransferase
LWGAVILGFGLRLLCLGCKSLWLDEALSVRAAQLDLQTLAAGSVERYHPPLYFLILGFWRRIGTSVAFMRLFSALAGGFSVALVYALGKTTLDEPVALSGAWLMALAPLPVWYAQELRDYSLLVFLVLLAMFSLARLMRKPGLIWWLLFVAAVTASLYTHYAAFFALPLHVFLVVGMVAGGRGSWLNGVFALLGWAATGGLYQFWLRTPAAQAFLELLTSDRFYFNVLTAGRQALPSALQDVLMMDYSRIATVLVVVLLVGFVIALALLFWLLRRRSAWFVKLRTSSIFRGLLLLLFVALLVLAVVPRGYSLKRYSLVFWPFALLGFAWMWPWTSDHRRSLALLVMVSLLASLLNIFVVPKPQWKQAAHLVLDKREADDIVLFSPSYMDLVFNFYAEDRVPMAGIRGGEVATTLASLFESYDRVWFIYHTADVGRHQSQIRQWLMQHAHPVDQRSFYRVQVDLYRR